MAVGAARDPRRFRRRLNLRASQPQPACGFGRSLDAIAWLGVLQSAEGFTPKRFALIAVGLAMTFVAFCRGAGFPTEWSGA